MGRASLFAVLAFAVALLAADAPVAFGADGSCAAAAPVVVVGSLNVDFTIRVDRQRPISTRRSWRRTPP